MYKAVVSDLDGTLLNEEHKVSLFTKETIELLLEKGIKFYIATGRGYVGAKEIMDEIGLKIPLITSNGARIVDENGREIYVNNIEQEYVDKIFSIDYKSFDKGIILNGFSGNHWYVTEDARDYFYAQKPNGFSGNHWYVTEMPEIIFMLKSQIGSSIQSKLSGITLKNLLLQKYFF